MNFVLIQQRKKGKRRTTRQTNKDNEEIRRQEGNKTITIGVVKKLFPAENKTCADQIWRAEGRMTPPVCSHATKAAAHPLRCFSTKGGRWSLGRARALRQTQIQAEEKE